MHATQFGTLPSFPPPCRAPAAHFSALVGRPDTDFPYCTRDYSQPHRYGRPALPRSLSLPGAPDSRRSPGGWRPRAPAGWSRAPRTSVPRAGRAGSCAGVPSTPKEPMHQTTPPRAGKGPQGPGMVPESVEGPKWLKWNSRALPRGSLWPSLSKCTKMTWKPGRIQSELSTQPVFARFH